MVTLQRVVGVFFLVGLLAVGSIAVADPNAPAEPPVLSLILENSGLDPFVYEPLLSEFEYEADTGKYKLKFEQEIKNVFPDIDLLIEEIEFDPDPSVIYNILVTNNSASTQILTQGLAQPTTFGAPNLISGSITTQAIDGGSDGATVAALANNSIYQAQIDLSTVATMQDDPFSVVAPAQGVGNALASFGPTLNNIPVTSSMGIQLNFSLTPGGDAASILSRFDVVIPEPSGVFLSGLGLVFFGLLRPKR